MASTGTRPRPLGASHVSHSRRSLQGSCCRPLVTDVLASCAWLVLSGSCLSPMHPAIAHAGDLRQCDPKASCVSSSAIRSPSQYMPAWDFAPTERDHALAAVVSTVRELELDGQAQLLETDLERGYVKARLRYDLKGRPDWDLLEIWLRKDQIALFRMESDMALPNPPGCFLRNCINGPRTRAHASAFQARLGWPSLETDEDKGWKPLFLH